MSYIRNRFGGVRSQPAAAARASVPFVTRPFASESEAPRKIRLIRNAVTDEVEQDTYGNDTVFSRYKESDFLELNSDKYVNLEVPI